MNEGRLELGAGAAGVGVGVVAGGAWTGGAGGVGVGEGEGEGMGAALTGGCSCLGGTGETTGAGLLLTTDGVATVELFGLGLQCLF